MTLNTSVWIERSYDPQRMFRYLQKLIGSENGQWKHVATPGDEHWRPEDLTLWAPSFHNSIGQGFPAILEMTYGLDGYLKNPYPPEEDDDEPDTWPRASFHITWDTTYGYQRTSDNGAGCEDLHAYLIMACAAAARYIGSDWWWQNEFTGETWDGESTEGKAALLKFGNAERGALDCPRVDVAKELSEPKGISS